MSAARWNLALLLMGIASIAGCRSQEHPAGEGKGEEHATSQEGSEEHDAKGVHVSRAESGNALVAIDDATQQRVGLKIQKLAKSSRSRTLNAFGRLEQDPAETFTLRTPLAGFLVGQPAIPWPNLGQSINAGTLIGQVRPRLGPVEMFDMRTRLATAHSEVEEVAADLEAAQKSLASKQLLNKDQKVVSQRTLEEAERDVKKGETRLAAAKETVKLLEDAVGQGQGISVALPLTIERSGQVTQVDAQPGEAVESGQIILKVANQSKLIARIDLTACPPGEVISEPLAATMEVGGARDSKFAGRFVGATTPMDIIASGRSFLFSIDDSAHRLSPGLPVVASMEMPGPPREGVAVPDSAILRYAGSAWVYLKNSEGKFERVPIDDATPFENGWFTSSLPGDSEVITVGAALLLSEELKSQIEAEAEGSE